MSYNQLLEIEKHTFHQNFALETLDFSNNDLRVISCTFAHLKFLRTLDLSSNRLSGFTKDVFSPLLAPSSPVNLLDISNNHFDCDCDILWLKDEVYNPQIKVKEAITGKTSGRVSPVKCVLPDIAREVNSFLLGDLLKNRKHSIFDIIQLDLCG